VPDHGRQRQRDGKLEQYAEWRRAGRRIDRVDPFGAGSGDTSIIFSEVSYGYKPTIGYIISGTLTLSDAMYMSPRQSTTVTHT
jgi:hypothetical protein